MLAIAASVLFAIIAIMTLLELLTPKQIHYQVIVLYSIASKKFINMVANSARVACPYIH